MMPKRTSALAVKAETANAVPASSVAKNFI